MARILILTAIKTGSGHRSSSNAIEKQLQKKGYETKQVDVFPMMGKMGKLMENAYIPITTRAPLAFYMAERSSEYFPDSIHVQVYLMVRKNLLKEIKEFKPDIIISVHVMFTRAVSYLIQKEHLNIPFYICVVDLIDPPSLWEDENADVTFVPTEEIRNDYLSDGFEEDRVLVSGFPVREDIASINQVKTVGDQINILMINASTQLKKNLRFLEEVSRLDNAKIDFVCGLDERMYEVLKEKRENKELRDNVTIHGFINNVNELLENAHIVMTKAGPNMIMEAVHSGTAIIITGHIKGQESYNYKYVIDNEFGLKCEDPDIIYDVVRNFIDGGDLQICLNKMAEAKISNGAEYIANYIEEHLKN